MQTAYMLIAIGALAVIAGLTVITKRTRPQTGLSPLATLAFLFVLSGIFFSEDRSVSYGLMGAGVLIALVDIARKREK